MLLTVVWWCAEGASVDSEAGFEKPQQSQLSMEGSIENELFGVDEEVSEEVEGKNPSVFRACRIDESQ